MVLNGVTKHTLYVANDNDFLPMIADPHKSPGDTTRGMVPNPNRFYVFAFDDSDLPGFMSQRIRAVHDSLCNSDGHDERLGGAYWRH